VQAGTVDDDMFAELENVLPGEGALRIAPEILIGAVEAFQRMGGEG
jgi:hypothetical protein